MAQRSLVVNFVGDTAALEKSFARVSTGLNGIEAAGKRASRAGASLTRGLTVPIVGLGVAAAKMSIDFGASMERLRTQAGVSQKGVAALSKGVLAMAGQVGIGPKTLADGMYHVASSLNATLPPSKRASTELNVLRLAAEGARVGNANLIDVTNALDAAVVSGIKGVQNYSQAMGALNAIVGAGDMSMQDLADALGTGLLAPMKRYGLTLTEVGGALADFGDNNIRGQDAATKLASAVRIMAAPSKAAAKELATVGLSTLQLANDMRRGGIVKALTDLQKHLTDSGLTASQQGLVMARAFGGKQSKGVDILLGDLERLRVKTKDVGAGATGFAQAWNVAQLTASQKTKRALATMEADLTKFGTVALPTLLSAGSTIVKDVDKVAHAFSSLPKGAQDAIITGGLITAGVGPALKLVGVVTGLVGKSWGLLRGIAGLAGLGKGAGSLLGGKSLQTVGTMEVGTLIAKSMIGGGGTSAGRLSQVERDAAAAAGAGGASFRSDLTSSFSAAAKVGGGVLAATFVNEAFSQFVQSASAHRAASVEASLNLPASVISQLTQTTGPKGYPIMSPVRTNLPYGDQGNVLFSLAQSAIKTFNATGATQDLDAVIQRATALRKLFPQNQAALNQFIAALSTMERRTHIAKSLSETNRQLTLLYLHRQGVTQTAAALERLGGQAKKLGDLKLSFADRLSAEFVKGRTVSARGIQSMIREVNKLPPAQRAAAEAGMLAMTRQFETKGLLVVGSTRKLRGEIAAELDAMAHKAESSAARMASAIQGGSMKAFTAARTNFGNLFLSINAAMQASVISVQQGVATINQAVNSELKAFHAGPINFGAKNLNDALSHFPQMTPGVNLGAKNLNDALSNFPKLSSTFPSPPATKSIGSGPATRSTGSSSPSGAGTTTGSSPSALKLPAALRTSKASKVPAWLTALAAIPSQTVQNQIRAQALQNAAAAAAGNDAAQQAAITRELALEKSFLLTDKRQLERVNAVLARHRLNGGQRAKLQGYKLAIENELGSLLGTISGLDSSLTSASSAGGFDLAPGNIKLPTAYDVGHAIHRGRRGGGSHVTVSPTFHIDATNAADARVVKKIVDQAVAKMADELERATGNHMKARMRAAGLRGS